MTDPSDMSDREGMAAEYVIGTLPLAERLEAERLIASDPDFAALVDGWVQRLAPLNDDYPEMAPSPALLPRIEARLFAPVRPAARWRMPFFGAFAAIAAAVALLVAWPTLRPHETLTATLRADGQPLVVAALFDKTAGQLTFTRDAGPDAGAAKDYELWVIPAGGAPISLGVLRTGPRTVAMSALPPGTTLAITLEPTGGSPNGSPTGPVVAAAVIGQG